MNSTDDIKRKYSFLFANPPRQQYTGRNINPAYYLHYDWTGWPSEGTVLPPQTAETARQTAKLWEGDGFRLLEVKAETDKVQILFGVVPRVKPLVFCARVKGRLQYSLKKSGFPVKFSRKVSFRSIGKNTAATVREYIRKQVGKEGFLDPRYVEIMRRFTIINNRNLLSEPSETLSGRYWYNIHLVLVVAERYRITDPVRLERIRDEALSLAGKNGHRIAALSVMPDHLHMALRGKVDSSPEEIALEFQNGLARAAGCPVWQDEYYTGTFSEYDLRAINPALR